MITVPPPLLAIRQVRRKKLEKFLPSSKVSRRHTSIGPRRACELNIRESGALIYRGKWQAAKRQFHKLDKDHSGTVDRNELEGAIASFGAR